MASLYSAANVYVTPAIEDNLPNTVMEALACGTPVVAFNTGGIPDMVDHLQNGYLAQFKSGIDFAKGINYVLNSGNGNRLAANARKKVLDKMCIRDRAEGVAIIFVVHAAILVAHQHNNAIGSDGLFQHLPAFGVNLFFKKM